MYLNHRKQVKLDSIYPYQCCLTGGLVGGDGWLSWWGWIAKLVEDGWLSWWGWMAKLVGDVWLSWWEWAAKLLRMGG